MDKMYRKSGKLMPESRIYSYDNQILNKLSTLLAKSKTGIVYFAKNILNFGPGCYCVLKAK
jgi:hypothetical protein